MLTRKRAFRVRSDGVWDKLTVLKRLTFPLHLILAIHVIVASPVSGQSNAMPEEPELAKARPQIEDLRLGASSPGPGEVHHLYTDLQNQLAQYKQTWSTLPQVKVPEQGGAMRLGATGPRVSILRERLGLEAAAVFDEALKSKLVEYQSVHGLKPDGVAGAATLASLNRGAVHYENLLLLNMARVQHIPRNSSRYILVDAGSARLWMYEDGQPVDTMKVVVGSPQTATPMMTEMIRYASLNPYWNVPANLVSRLIAPNVVRHGVGYLEARGYEVVDSWRPYASVVDPATVDWRAVADGKELYVRQLPGPQNSMGEVKFMMPNEFGIYLHDTPNKELFNEDSRWLSNGCVRVEDARRLAKWVFGEMPIAAAGIANHRAGLKKPLPVYITYLTAEPEASKVLFRADPYQRDGAALKKLEETAQMAYR